MWTTQASRRVVETRRSGAVTQVSLVFPMGWPGREGSRGFYVMRSAKASGNARGQMEKGRPHHGGRPSPRTGTPSIFDGDVVRNRLRSIDGNRLACLGDGGVAGPVADGHLQV